MAEDEEKEQAQWQAEAEDLWPSLQHRITVLDAERKAMVEAYLAAPSLSLADRLKCARAANKKLVKQELKEIECVRRGTRRPKYSDPPETIKLLNKRCSELQDYTFRIEHGVNDPVDKI